MFTKTLILLCCTALVVAASATAESDFETPSDELDSDKGRKRYQTTCGTSVVGDCADEELIYRPFNYTIPLSATLKSTNAEIAFCKDYNPDLTKPLNTSTLLQGCASFGGCDYNCKALGTRCSQRNRFGGTNFLECCNARIDGKTEVAGKCNKKTGLCIPSFPLNTVCGDASKDYLDCYKDSDCHDGTSLEVTCRFPWQAMQYASDKVSRVSTESSPNKVGVKTVKKCLQGFRPCTSPQALKIFCGKNLPFRYNDYPFCDCPSPDLKTGFHCVGTACKPCKLQGVKCSTDSDCCISHVCQNNLCRQCLQTGFFTKVSGDSQGDYKCCKSSDYYKTFEGTYFCANKPTLGSQDAHPTGK